MARPLGTSTHRDTVARFCYHQAMFSSSSHGYTVGAIQFHWRIYRINPDSFFQFHTCPSGPNGRNLQDWWQTETLHYPVVVDKSTCPNLPSHRLDSFRLWTTMACSCTLCSRHPARLLWLDMRGICVVRSKFPCKVAVLYLKLKARASRDAHAFCPLPGDCI